MRIDHNRDVSVTVHNHYEQARTPYIQLPREYCIYVVDDCDLIAEVHANVLTSYLDVRCKIFLSPCTAFNAIVSGEDLVAGVVSDISMYDKDCHIGSGLALVNYLRRAGFNPPVLLVSALDSLKDLKDVSDVGAFYCSKDNGGLAEAVSRYVSNPEIRSPTRNFFSAVAEYAR